MKLMVYYICLKGDFKGVFIVRVFNLLLYLYIVVCICKVDY